MTDKKQESEEEERDLKNVEYGTRNQGKIKNME